MPNYQAAKTEIAKPAYNGLSDAAIATALNALPAVTQYRSINPVDARNALILTSNAEWGWLRGVADGWVTSANASGLGAVAVVTTPAGSGGATRRAARSLVDLFTGDETIPLVAADVTLLGSATDTLISANVMTAAGKAKLVALAQTSVPQWQAWEFTEAFTEQAVAAVKAWVP
jgi:hypothetical protein